MNTVRLIKLMVAVLVRKLLSFYETRAFIIFCTIIHLWTFLWAGRILSALSRLIWD